MDLEASQYLETMLFLVEKELDLYVRYAVRTREDGGIRHIYQTRIFKEELQNILEDAFASVDWEKYGRERKALWEEWDLFHESARRQLREGVMIPLEYMICRFRLTEFEAYCVCLAASRELNREFERMFCYLQDDRNLGAPTLDLCMKMFTMDSLRQKELLHQVERRRKLLQCLFQKRGDGAGNGPSWKLRLRRDLAEYLFFYESDLLERKIEYYLYVPQGEEGKTRENPCGEEAWARENSCGEEAKTSENSPGKEVGISADPQGENVKIREDFLGKEVGISVNPQVEQRICQYLREEASEGKRLFVLQGAKGSGRKRQVKMAAKAQGRTALFLDIEEIQKLQGEQKKERIKDAVVRAALSQSYLCCYHWEALETGGVWDNGTILEILGKAGLFFSVVFVVTERFEQPEETLLEDYQIEQFEMLPPNMEQRMGLWKEFLSGKDLADAISFEMLAAQFEFSPGMMKEAAEEAKQKADDASGGRIGSAQIYEVCQQKISHRLGQRADRVNAAYTWEDLILQENQKELLKQACSHVTFRYRVYEEWGFRQKMAYGRGVSMLFFGPPGTGKTMAAQVIANQLNLELYRVDLSGVLSKYIGETQKNIKEIFEEGKKSRSILFFYVSDALFGKRVNVTDARDISANAQTAYLLQKMEEYDGITILATNLMQNFDDAYKRRIKYMISFALPQKEQRLKLWEKVFPAQMPLGEDIDMEYLACNFELSGASIKNIAINASFLAASKGQAVGMEHIMASLQQEYQKAGKTLGKEELKEYHMYKR